MPTMGVGSVAKSCTINSCRSKSSLTEASALQSSTQMPEKELDPPPGMSQQERRACSGVNTCMPADSVRTTNHMAFITAASLLPHSSPCSPLPQSSPDNPVIAKKAPCSTASPVIPVSKCAHAKMDICNAQTPLDNCPSPVGFSNPPRVLSASHPRSGCVRGSSSELTSGLSFQKHASVKSQGEPLTSDAHLRDISGTVCTCRFASSVEMVKDGQCRSKGVGCRGSCDTSVDDIIEEVILKHCYGILPGTFSFQEEEAASPLHLKPLLDHSNTEGSDISFNVESPMQLGVSQPKAAMRDLNFLKQTHVTLEDDKYESHLRSVLNRGPVEVMDDVQLVKWTPSEESVLPALPHVPPSFVGKTWSQVMYEDDLKIEALVRDFREGRFHCHFDSDSLTNCEEKRSPRIKKPKVEGSEPVTGSWPESVSAKALPVFSDDISEAPGSVNPSVAYDTLCKPSTVQKLHDFDYDIALLKLKNDLTFSNKIWPVCLPCTDEMNKVLSLPEVAEKEKCIYQDRILTGHGGNEEKRISGYVTGWGHFEKSYQPLIFKQAEITIQTLTRCTKDAKLFTENMICAIGKEGQDACKGDSGGPFVVRMNRRWIQVGIVSHGTAGDCGKSQVGFYTSVPMMMEWIRSKVGKVGFE